MKPLTFHGEITIEINNKNLFSKEETDFIETILDQCGQRLSDYFKEQKQEGVIKTNSTHFYFPE